MILADTSIWIDHIRYADSELRRIIEDDRLLCHPAVIGELALGSFRDRDNVIAFLAAQREAFVATHDEVMMMIDRHALFSMGIGYTDAHLMASVLLDQRAALWTRDKRLRAAAEMAGASLHPLPTRETKCCVEALMLDESRLSAEFRSIHYAIFLAKNGTFYFQARHARKNNGFPLEILECPDAICN